MAKEPKEWLKQAEYDFETAELMVSGGRYFYSVFMCHLALEKALKGFYQHVLGHAPPRTHSLLYLINEVGVKPGESLARFFVRLNQASIATRYPEDLEALQNDYTRATAQAILSQAREAVDWIKKQF